MSRNVVFIVIFAIVLAVVLVLALRTPADAQEVSTAKAEELLQTAIDNIIVHQASAELKYLQTVTDIDETLSLLTQPSEFIVVFSDGVLSPITLEELAELGKIEEDYEQALQQVFADLVSEGDLLYLAFVNDQMTHLTISPDATRVAGVLPTASRLPGTAYYPREQPERHKECASKILSRDIFNKPAERIRACSQTTCSQGAPSTCELLHIEASSGWFGFVSYQPETPPEPAEIVGEYCRGIAYYKWGVKIGGISLGDYVAIDIDNFALGGQGNLISEVHCGD